MHLRIVICFYLTFQVSHLFSQLKGGIYQFPERFTPNYFFDPNLSYQKIKDVQVKGFTSDQMEFYKIHKTYNTQRDFDNNTFYMEWNDLERYLYKIMDTILSPDIKGKQPYDIFIKRDINYNASALGNGFMYANIGLIANCKTEAELAYVLGHEFGHSVFNHGYLISSEVVSSYNRNDVSAYYSNFYSMFDKMHYAELQSDSFAFQSLNNATYNLHAALSSLQLIAYNEYTSQFYIKGTRRTSFKNYTEKFGSHPSFSERNRNLKAFMKHKKNTGKNYVIDSVYFQRVKKIAHEECKKISMENGQFEDIMRLSFVDYLQGDNSFKNLFYLFESLRKYIYANPQEANKGFLAGDLQFTEFENLNYSILKKPELLFMDSLSYVKCKKHPLLSNPSKPFNTYEDAYIYFVQLAEEKNFSEALFSKALYFYSKKETDNFNNYLDLYLKNGTGIYKDFAVNLKTNGFPYIKTGKTTVLIDNSSNNTRSDNYYHSLMRIKFSSEIKNVFKSDTSKIKLTLMNDLLGIKPRELYTYQKLKSNISSLYNEDDEFIFYKLRYLQKENMEEREKRNRYNKNLLIFVPDWYNWFVENNFNGVVLQDINYDYKFVTEENEYHNFYTLKYINCFDNRPFFGKCIRTGSVRKQSNVDMAKEIKDYLWSTN